MTADITITTASVHSSRGADTHPGPVKAFVRRAVIAVATGAVAFAAVACGSSDASPDEVRDIPSGKSKPTSASAPR